MGIYPAVSLAEARARRDRRRSSSPPASIPRSRRSSTASPARPRRATPSALVAEEYVDNLRLRGRAEITVAKNRWLLEGWPRRSPIARSPRSPPPKCSTF